MPVSLGCNPKGVAAGGKRVVTGEGACAGTATPITRRSAVEFGSITTSSWSVPKLDWPRDASRPPTRREQLAVDGRPDQPAHRGILSVGLIELVTRHALPGHE